MVIALVTDSTSDLPVDLARANQIHVIPNQVIIDGQSLEDGKDISRREFYERLPDMETPPTTATTSSGAYQQVYEKLFQQGAEHIISIHAPSVLSGIFNAASIAANEFNGRVDVLDSGQLSLGLGFQALAAAEAIALGVSLDEVLNVIDDVRQRVRVIAMLDTLEYVHRSGRVSWARARLGNLLRLKAFIEVKEGQVHSLGQARTRRKGVAHLQELLLNLGALERLAILHTNAESDAFQFLDDLDSDIPADPLVINVTTVIGAHVGPNGLGFAAVVK